MLIKLFIMRKFYMIFLLFVLCSCNIEDSCPTNRIFEVNLNVDKASLIEDGYKLNNDGFPILGKTVGDTLFLYILTEKGRINYKEASFVINENFKLTDFLEKRRCELMDSIIGKEGVEYYIRNNLNEFKIDIHRRRIFIRYYFTPVEMKRQ